MHRVPVKRALCPTPPPFLPAAQQAKSLKSAESKPFFTLHRAQEGNFLRRSRCAAVHQRRDARAVQYCHSSTTTGLWSQVARRRPKCPLPEHHSRSGLRAGGTQPAKARTWPHLRPGAPLARRTSYWSVRIEKWGKRTSSCRHGPCGI